MNTQPQDLQAILTRIETLERQNRWLKRVGLVASLSLIAIVTMGQARTSRTVEAERFLLRGMNGTIRGELVVKDIGPTFRLYDSNGEDQVAIGIDPKVGPHLSLLDPASKANFIVYLEPLLGAKLGFGSASGKSSVDFSTVGGAGMRITDEDGYFAVLGSSDLVLKKTGEKRTTSAASLKLFDRDGKVIWSAP